jgi:hypothetical protein
MFVGYKFLHYVLLSLEEIVSKSTFLATRPSRLAPEKCINKSIWLAPGGHLPWVHHGYLLGANQIDLFMHFLGASRDGLVARRVDLNTISSSVLSQYDMVCLLCMCGVGISLGCGVPSSARWLAITLLVDPMWALTF